MKMTLPPTHGIYRIRNTETNDSYIGSAKKLNTRWNGHVYCLRKGIHHSPHLQHSWDKYGADKFIVEVVEVCSAVNLLDREQWWIDNSSCVFNVSSRAESPSHDLATKLKIGKASKAKGEVFHVFGELLSVGDIKSRYGVAHSVFYNRLNRGWSVETAATTTPNKKHSANGARVYEYRGKLHTLAELTPYASCSKTSLFRRIKSGMSVVDAVELSKEGAEARRIRNIYAARSAT